MSPENEGGPFPPDEGGSTESRVGFVPEFVKKVAVAGLGAIFMTEEGLRSLAGQLKLPKELLGVVLSQAEKTKDEIGRVVSEELRRFMQSEKLRQEFLRLLTGMTVEVTAQVRLVPSESKPGGEPEQPQGEVAPKVVVTEVSTKRHGRKSPSGGDE